MGARWPRVRPDTLPCRLPNATGATGRWDQPPTSPALASRRKFLPRGAQVAPPLPPHDPPVRVYLLGGPGAGSAGRRVGLGRRLSRSPRLPPAAPFNRAPPRLCPDAARAGYGRRALSLRGPRAPTCPGALGAGADRPPREQGVQGRGCTPGLGAQSGDPFPVAGAQDGGPLRGAQGPSLRPLEGTGYQGCRGLSLRGAAPLRGAGVGRLPKPSREPFLPSAPVASSVGAGCELKMHEGHILGLSGHSSLLLARGVHSPLL